MRHLCCLFAILASLTACGDGSSEGGSEPAKPKADSQKTGAQKPDGTAAKGKPELRYYYISDN